MPLKPDVVTKRAGGHLEYRASYNTQKRLVDSLVGGQVYRDATYGSDTFQLPIYNLVRHKRERPNPREFEDERSVAFGGLTHGADQALQAMANGGTISRVKADPARTTGVDDFELRRARTPVPEILGDIVGEHLDRIYRHEVTRKSTDRVVQDFWADVDGKGTPVDVFMKDHAGPIYLATGWIHIRFDRPTLPPGEEPPKTIADQRRQRLDRVVASVVMPENLVWWKLDPAGTGAYAEVMVRVFDEDDLGGPIELYEHWTADECTVYNDEGKVVSVNPNKFGRVPVITVFDGVMPGRKHTPKSNYEGVAERMREVYNLMSELVLSDTQQSHPILTMHESYCQADNSIPVGPGFVLPIKVEGTEQGGSKIPVPPAYITPPKGPAESLRINIVGHLERAYSQQGLQPPELFASGDRKSGIAKELDFNKLNGILVKRARSLQRLEEALVAGVRLVTVTTPTAKTPKVTVHYPSKFGSFSAETLIGLYLSLQMSYAEAGRLPENDKAVLKLIVREMDPGRSEEEYSARDAEIDSMVAENASHIKEKDAAALEMTKAGIESAKNPPTGVKNVPEGTVQPERSGKGRKVAAPSASNGRKKASGASPKG